MSNGLPAIACNGDEVMSNGLPAIACNGDGGNV